MYDSHYNFIKKNLDANLLFTDADILTYEIKSKDVYEEFFKYKQGMTLVNINQVFFDRTNKKVIGSPKVKGTPINKFIGSKPKMYCIVADGDTEINTAKGVNISIEFNEYKDV